jgi:hypothetical protein
LCRQTKQKCQCVENNLIHATITANLFITAPYGVVPILL